MVKRTGSDREDIHGLDRKRDPQLIERISYEAEIRRHFENRLARLEIVRTTRAPLGQAIDWVPRKSQLPKGMSLGEPRQGKTRLPAEHRKRPDLLVPFELDDRKVERGPKGTIPILRKTLDSISFGQSVGAAMGSLCR